MYAIIVQGKMAAVCDKPRYVKVSESSGCYVESGPEEAAALSVDGTLYNLPGKSEIPGAPEAVITEVEGGALLFAQSVQLRQAEDTAAITYVSLAEAGKIDAASAGEHIALFALWAEPVSYQAGNIRQHEGKLYKCLTGHTSQADWTPDNAPSLWVQIADPNEEWPAWSQPIGAADAYPRGSKVFHQGEHWESEADNNVWEPGVYGWALQPA